MKYLLLFFLINCNQNTATQNTINLAVSNDQATRALGELYSCLFVYYETQLQIGLYSTAWKVEKFPEVYTKVCLGNV